MSTPHETPDFSGFISNLDQGRVEQHLTEELAKVVEAVEETGAKGEVTIKITVKKSGAGMAQVDIEAKSKIPKHPLHGTLFYIGENGGLLRDDPRQLQLKNLEPPKLKVTPPSPGGTDEPN